MIHFFRMINQCSKKCSTVMRNLPLSCLPLHTQRPQYQSFGTQPSRLQPYQTHSFIGLRSDLPKTCFDLSFELNRRQMSSLPPTMPPVIHHTEKQEFTLSFPGHQSAYLRYTRSPDRCAMKLKCFQKNVMPIIKHFIPICPTFSLTMYTTVVPDSLGGRGVAKLLADEAFDFAVKEKVLLKLC